MGWVVVLEARRLAPLALERRQRSGVRKTEEPCEKGVSPLRAVSPSVTSGAQPMSPRLGDDALPDILSWHERTAYKPGPVRHGTSAETAD
jgi:hypothetical protein